MKILKYFLITLLLLQVSGLHSETNGDTTKNGYGRGKVGIFFKRYFDFRNAGSNGKYKRSQTISTRLTFPFNSKGYKLSFYDEFDSLDLKKWQIGQAWGRVHFQNPHQHYSDLAVSVNDGKLSLFNLNEPKSFEYRDSTYLVPYGVGCINSFHSFSTKHGYFAIRSKTPIGTATWPAFWLTGKKSWPPEIDIFEMYGKCDTANIHEQTMSVHYGSIEGKTKGSITKNLNLPQNTNTIFHIYSCLWEPKKITFFTDGVLVKTVKLNRWMRKYFDEEMYVIINNAIDNRYIDCLEANQLPHKFEIDWVRVYTK